MMEVSCNCTVTTTTTTHQSHLVKHTDFISTLTVTVLVMVVHARTHAAHARLPHGGVITGAHGPRGRDPCRTTGTGHVCWVWCRNRLAIVHLRHTPHASASQTRVLVAVAPAVDCPLDEASLATQARVQLRERPAHSVALRLVLQSVATVLILGTACAGVHAVFRLEIALELIRVHRLHIAPNGVLHLDAVARIFKCDPLNAIVVLPDHQRCRCRYRTRSRVVINTGRRARRRRQRRSAILAVLWCA